VVREDGKELVITDLASLPRRTHGDSVPTFSFGDVERSICCLDQVVWSADGVARIAGGTEAGGHGDQSDRRRSR
jgi:hypothetical protein